MILGKAYYLCIPGFYLFVFAYYNMLPPETFLRIHHPNIINKFYVERYIRGDGGQVVMRNGILLDVSKRNKSEFLQAMGY